METKICKCCERELPIAEFPIVKGGARKHTCKACQAAKRAETCLNRRILGGGGSQLLSDPEFDDKDPGEVIRMMGRAQRWLQSRGYTIRLEGEYTETKVHKLKFFS